MINGKISPTQYFNRVKGKKNYITSQALKDMYDLEKQEADKMIKNGQIESAKRLLFHIKNIKREQEAVNAGYRYYIFRDDIDTYIDDVATDCVRIIDLESYERSIPDNISKEVQKAKKYFDNLYIIYTDYTDKSSRKIEREKRQRDPILLGAFVTKENNDIIWNHRLYYITDWIDEYCDLTLDKFISQMPNRTVKEQPKLCTVEQLENRLKELEKDND